ncbi:MAG: hypothetical protein CBD74_08000 [Saprospirales bacterium TMED214]|uniref:hypothetical protein n=1 Tax=Candidatus Pelagisphaera phototrophica TaxID=2684113 RepID=UPI000B6BADD2|nr:hypothetical protein [Candidatus Pelagisphaera phototrophica]OUW81665.1 MAG: hypothetical protein CBD74_08000 [Saprospirales bacterium TMED214]QXD32462.1 hypothetical protein GA004_01685 [Candidatus Pelagisphaera phototrophica]
MAGILIGCHIFQEILRITIWNSTKNGTACCHVFVGFAWYEGRLVARTQGMDGKVGAANEVHALFAA